MGDAKTQSNSYLKVVRTCTYILVCRGASIVLYEEYETWHGCLNRPELSFIVGLLVCNCWNECRLKTDRNRKKGRLFIWTRVKSALRKEVLWIWGSYEKLAEFKGGIESPCWFACKLEPLFCVMDPHRHVKAKISKSGLLHRNRP